MEIKKLHETIEKLQNFIENELYLDSCHASSMCQYLSEHYKDLTYSEYEGDDYEEDENDEDTEEETEEEDDDAEEEKPAFEQAQEAAEPETI